jgi:D-arabinose 1-dehydrogenase-like Zn-dependent alcohol dehydrogenase
MKAVVLTAFKQPLQVRDVPIAEPGPGQVRVRIKASGVCGTDVHVWQGELPVPTPMVLGHEPAGVVDAVGPGVTSVSPGDRVGVSWFQGGCGHCPYCQQQQYKFCAAPITWISNGGSHAEYMLAEAEGCVLLPDGLSFQEAAPLFCGGFAAMSAYRQARPQANERIAIIGMGGLGHLALQVARLMGHEVVAITGSPAKRRELLEMGASEVLVSEEHPGKELFAMGGADIVLSFSPSMEQNTQVMEGLRPNGRLITTAVSGDKIQADPVSMLFKQTAIIGSAHNHRQDLEDILQLVAAGKVKPQLETYALENINHVLERLVEGKVRYRAVLTVE